eukprot:4748073-Pleurochrysis_carterae.AAC.1
MMCEKTFVFSQLVALVPSASVGSAGFQASTGAWVMRGGKDSMISCPSADVCSLPSGPISTGLNSGS